jgi:hypothetical protein
MERKKPTGRDRIVDVLMMALFILAAVLLYPSWRHLEKDMRQE